MICLTERPKSSEAATTSAIDDKSLNTKRLTLATKKRRAHIELLNSARSVSGNNGCKTQEDLSATKSQERQSIFHRVKNPTFFQGEATMVTTVA